MSDVKLPPRVQRVIEMLSVSLGLTKSQTVGLTMSVVVLLAEGKAMEWKDIDALMDKCERVR